MRQLKKAPQPDYLSPGWLTPWAAFQAVAGHNNQDGWDENETLDTNSMRTSNTWKQLRDFLVTGKVSYIIQGESGNHYEGRKSDWATDEAYKMFNTGEGSVSVGPLYFEYVERGIILILERDLAEALAPTNSAGDPATDAGSDLGQGEEKPAPPQEENGAGYIDDSAELEEMKVLIKGGTGVHAASVQLAPQAGGGGTVESRGTRLYRKIRAQLKTEKSKNSNNH